ncbi:MAG: tRNA uridine-5-carboxymethylaminomethyl(34) synthesis GTPase MnmE [Micropepsaceae bacterium]
MYALASASGRAGVAVVRLSGPASRRALTALAPGFEASPRTARRITLRDPSDNALIDEGLALIFPAPNSFTGEDVVELHIHGSPATLQRLFPVLSGLGLRAAGPGEFTRRAFTNGKIDLTAAEGLADLIAADSDAQRAQALAQMGGAWAKVITDWQTRLLDALALLEAGIDFVDEDDVPDSVTDSVPERLTSIAAEMAAHLANGHRGEVVRDGLRVAIIGAPNVGKSTLLNALAGREAAIVSDIPGTTRDIVEVRLDLDGYVVVLADTAGQRLTDDPIEQEGVRRARAKARESDLRIFVMDSASRVGLETDDLMQPGDIVFRNKADLAPAAGVAPADLVSLAGSALTGAGLEALQDALTARVRNAASGPAVLITRQRHREALGDAKEALSRASNAHYPADLAAEDVRVALQALARITGRFDVDQVLDRIFAGFCIGK